MNDEKVASHHSSLIIPHSSFVLIRLPLRPAEADFRERPRADDDGELADAEALLVAVHARDATARRACARTLFRPRLRIALAARLLAAGACAPLVAGPLLALLLGVGRALLRHLALDLGVDLAADEDGRAGEVEPEHQD